MHRNLSLVSVVPSKDTQRRFITMHLQIQRTQMAAFLPHKPNFGYTQHINILLSTFRHEVYSTGHLFLHISYFNPPFYINEYHSSYCGSIRINGHISLSKNNTKVLFNVSSLFLYRCIYKFESICNITKWMLGWDIRTYAKLV